jgi:dinuclear metal center YbgI/SA1388 family protein
MSILLQDLVRWCDQTLAAASFKDYCPNGLQVEGKPVIERLVTGVTASQALIEAAIECQADAILVHHGYFWKGEAQPLTGIKGKRIKRLMQHDISLIAYHLPLDAHPLFGNNRMLADLLGFEIKGGLDPSETRPIGNVGHCAPLTVPEMLALMEDKLGRPAQHFTGGAPDFIHQAAAQGCDAYISGEVSERTFHDAAELGIHYFACGHHATERGGVKRLGEEIASQFGVSVEFIDLFNPV